MRRRCEWTRIDKNLERGWRGRPARPARRLAERNGIDARMSEKVLLRVAPLPVPSGGSPDGTGESPVPPTLNTYGGLSPKQGRVLRPGRIGSLPAFDGDKSPAKSADKSAHSKVVAALPRWVHSRLTLQFLFAAGARRVRVRAVQFSP